MCACKWGCDRKKVSAHFIRTLWSCLASLLPSRWMCVLAPWTKSRVLSQLCAFVCAHVCVWGFHLWGHNQVLLLNCDYTVTCFPTLYSSVCVHLCVCVRAHVCVLFSKTSFILYFSGLSGCCCYSNASEWEASGGWADPQPDTLLLTTTVSAEQRPAEGAGGESGTMVHTQTHTDARTHTHSYSHAY